MYPLRKHSSIIKKKKNEKSEKQKQKMDLEFESELTESKFYRAIL